MGKSPEKGAETLTYLIGTPASKLTSGEYYSNNTIHNLSAQQEQATTAQREHTTIITTVH